MNLQERTFELLEKTGLNWSVKKEPLFTAAGDATQSFGLFKSVNGETGNWLSTVGKRYVPYQNAELAEVMVQASEGINVQLNRGGMLNSGCKVYLQSELPDEYIGRSAIKRYITALNSHDGSSAIGFGSSSTVVICQNTFYMAYKEIQKFRHTLSAKDAITAAMQDMRKAMELDEALMHKFKVMADKPISEEIFAKVMAKCFKADLNVKSSEVSTRRKNTLTAVAGAVDKELALEGETLWGLFNGITRFTNHIATSKENKENYVMSGAGYETNLVAFNTIMDWIDSKTATSVLVS